ncbi:hypothetical protein HOLleu_21977 [Holothuria leucospilota]|uniref:Tyr recombinase domain-containing protein n=1 Tax=Holothuria leucospilota TaxID=206669 RepID=A0A9Q1BY98_HOLLE|nr:hypothetical protein HOLleu_21977 [Holothuria leucospilota]
MLTDALSNGYTGLSHRRKSCSIYNQILVKQQKSGSKPLQCVLHSYPVDSRLDVLKVLQHYIDLTKPVSEGRRDQTYVSPHKRVTTETLARWLKDVMRQSKIDTEIYKAHSTRAAAASLAHLNRVRVTEILNVAGWTSDKTHLQKKTRLQKCCYLGQLIMSKSRLFWFYWTAWVGTELQFCSFLKN